MQRRGSHARNVVRPPPPQQKRKKEKNAAMRARTLCATSLSLAGHTLYSTVCIQSTFFSFLLVLLFFLLSSSSRYNSCLSILHSCSRRGSSRCHHSGNLLGEQFNSKGNVTWTDRPSLAARRHPNTCDRHVGRSCSIISGLASVAVHSLRILEPA